MNRRFLLDNAALRALLRGTLMSLDEVDTLDAGFVFGRIDFEYNAFLALVFAAQDNNAITFAYLFHQTTRPYRTSLASEIIFMNCFSRSSRATGPKIRVPWGSS